MKQVKFKHYCEKCDKAFARGWQLLKHKVFDHSTNTQESKS